jgi:2-keto-3-deoxy-L-rhamnonate aldolase RhmA
MNGRQMRKALHAGRRVYGTLVISPSARWPGAVKALPIDFVFIDTEHIPLDRETVAWMCQTYAAMGLAPIVRVPEPNPFLATAAMDGGAHGVIFPYVERPEQVRDLVGAVRYRPLKGRRLADLIETGEAPSAHCLEYLNARNADGVAIINVESLPAIERLEQLVDVDGLDAVLVGPHDLSVSLGNPEDYADEAFDAAVRTILKTARRAGIGAGVHFFWQEIDREIEWMRAGMNLIVHNTDLRAAMLSLKADIDRLRATFGDAAPDRLGKDEEV